MVGRVRGRTRRWGRRWIQLINIARTARQASYGAIRMDTIHCIVSRSCLAFTIDLRKSQTVKLLLQTFRARIGAMAAAGTVGRSFGLRRVWSAVECVALALSSYLCRCSRQRGSDLVVGQVCLSAVRKEWEHGCNSFRARRLARLDGDEEFHQMIIDLSTSALHDEDILLPNALAHFDLGLADTEFGEVDFGGRDAEVCADRFRELRMRRAGEDDDISDHGDDGGERKMVQLTALAVVEQ